MNRIPKRSDKSISFDTARQQYKDVAKLNNIQFDPSKFNVISDSAGMYISMDVPEIEIIPEDFTIKSIQGLNVSFYGGTIVLGEKDYSIGDTSFVTIAEANAYVGWQFDYDTETLSMQNFSSIMTYEPSKLKKPLYTITANLTALTCYASRKLDVQLFPANFGR